MIFNVLAKSPPRGQVGATSSQLGRTGRDGLGNLNIGTLETHKSTTDATWHAVGFGYVFGCVFCEFQPGREICFRYVLDCIPDCLPPDAVFKARKARVDLRSWPAAVSGDIPVDGWV